MSTPINLESGEENVETPEKETLDGDWLVCIGPATGWVYIVNGTVTRCAPIFIKQWGGRPFEKMKLAASTVSRLPSGEDEE